MKHFINLKDISTKSLRKILADAKQRKKKRIGLNTLDLDKNAPLKGKILIQHKCLPYTFVQNIFNQVTMM